MQVQAAKTGDVNAQMMLWSKESTLKTLIFARFLRLPVSPILEIEKISFGYVHSWTRIVLISYTRLKTSQPVLP